MWNKMRGKRLVSPVFLIVIVIFTLRVVFMFSKFLIFFSLSLCRLNMVMTARQPTSSLACRPKNPPRRVMRLARVCPVQQPFCGFVGVNSVGGRAHNKKKRKLWNVRWNWSLNELQLDSLSQFSSGINLAFFSLSLLLVLSCSVGSVDEGCDSGDDKLLLLPTLWTLNSGKFTQRAARRDIFNSLAVCTQRARTDNLVINWR